MPVALPVHGRTIGAPDDAAGRVDDVELFAHITTVGGDQNNENGNGLDEPATT